MPSADPRESAAWLALVEAAQARLHERQREAMRAHRGDRNALRMAWIEAHREYRDALFGSER